MDIPYRYEDVPTIRAFARSDAFLRGLKGPFGSGKSSGCAIEILRRARAQRPGADGIRRTVWAVIRNTYGQLMDTTLPVFQQWVPPYYFGEWRATAHEYHITKFPGCDVLVKFRALDRPEQVANLLSLWLTGAWVNEAREVPWAIISALQGRVGRFPAIADGGPSWDGIIMDTNPPDIDSWWYRLFEEQRPGNAAQFSQPGGLSGQAENLRNLKPGYYENLAASMDANAKRVYVDGEYGFVLDGQPVFPEYEDDLHCKALAYIPSLPVYRGWDFGLTPACAMAQAVAGRVNGIDELCAESMGVDQFADEVITHCARYPGAFIDIGDPAGNQRAQTDERTCFEILQKKGIAIGAGLQTIRLRLEAVRKGLRTLVGGRPLLMIDPRCQRLRKGFNGAYSYRRLQVAADRYTDVPDKSLYSHPHDALQYLMTALVGEELRGATDPGPPPAAWHQGYDLLAGA